MKIFSVQAHSSAHIYFYNLQKHQISTGRTNIAAQRRFGTASAVVLSAGGAIVKCFSKFIAADRTIFEILILAGTYEVLVLVRDSQLPSFRKGF